MSWKAYRLPILAVVGFAAPPLLVYGIKSIPPEWIKFVEGPPKLEAPPKLNEPVVFAQRAPVEFDPFRKILSGPTKRVTFATKTPEPPVAAPIISTTSVPVPKAEPELPEIPDPRLEGVVGGEDPVAVLKIGEESRFVREGENLGHGLVVVSISEGEVRLKRGSHEIVLKTGV